MAIWKGNLAPGIGDEHDHHGLPTTYYSHGMILQVAFGAESMKIPYPSKTLQSPLRHTQMRRFCMDSGQTTIIPKPEWSGDFWGIPLLFTTIWGNSQPAGLGRYNLPRWIIYPQKNHQKFLVGLVPSLQPATTAPGDVSENFWQEISDHPTEGFLWIFFLSRAVARCYFFYFFFRSNLHFPKLRAT